MQKYIFFRDPIDSSMLNILFSRERDPYNTYQPLHGISAREVPRVLFDDLQFLEHVRDMLNGKVYLLLGMRGHQ